MWFIVVKRLGLERVSCIDLCMSLGSCLELTSRRRGGIDQIRRIDGRRREDQSLYGLSCGLGSGRATSPDVEERRQLLEGRPCGREGEQGEGLSKY